MSNDAVEAQVKHVQILDSIGTLHRAKRYMESLLTEVTNPPQPSDEKSSEVERTPPLSEFLDNSALEINKIAEELNAIRDNLHTALF